MKISQSIPYLFLLVLSSFQFAHGQESKPQLIGSENYTPIMPSRIIQIDRSSFHIPGKATGQRWGIQAKVRVNKHSDSTIKAIKDEQLIRKLNYEKTHEIIDSELVRRPLSKEAPISIGTKFEANNLSQSTPPDNHIAVSRNGYIVSVDNDGFSSFKIPSTKLTFEEDWSDFFNSTTLTAQLYDPKILYDDVENKFIMVVLHGNTPSTSRVIVSFSKSENPEDGWNNYILSGDITSDGLWFDYPSIGQSAKDFFVSGNRFSGQQYNKTILYQIRKVMD